VLKKIPRFFSSESQFQALHHKLKLLNCPFCRVTGCLNLHGFLYSYDNKPRGRRIFCSNRNKRKGCGRSFSILLAWLLKNFRLTALDLWTFISGLINGLSKQASWIKTGLSISQSFLYCLSRRLKTNVPYIRTKLLGVAPSFLQETFILLKNSSLKNNPIWWFQEHFQDDFLKHRPKALVF